MKTSLDLADSVAAHNEFRNSLFTLPQIQEILECLTKGEQSPRMVARFILDSLLGDSTEANGPASRMKLFRLSEWGDRELSSDKPRHEGIDYPSDREKALRELSSQLPLKSSLTQMPGAASLAVLRSDTTAAFHIEELRARLPAFGIQTGATAATPANAPLHVESPSPAAEAVQSDATSASGIQPDATDSALANEPLCKRVAKRVEELEAAQRKGVRQQVAVEFGVKLREVGRLLEKNRKNEAATRRDEAHERSVKSLISATSEQANLRPS